MHAVDNNRDYPIEYLQQVLIDTWTCNSGIHIGKQLILVNWSEAYGSPVEYLLYINLIIYFLFYFTERQ